MKFGYTDTCLEHDTGPRHPESADRLRAIRQGLERRHGVEYIESIPASVDVVTAVHDDSYVEKVRSFCADGGGNWDPDTVAVEETWDAALASAGLALGAVEAAFDGADGRETPFALGRPPGHHAVSDDAMGFCFFNNAAIGAQHAIDEGDSERVAIFDWDVHHGNGTQDIFYDRGDVLYASIHEEGIYPGTGDVDEIGSGDGEGTTINAPLPAGCGDPAYTFVVDEVLEPLLVEFDPDLLVVSAGFDAHRRDPISRMTVTTEGYGHLARRLREIATDVDARIAFVLEGGYGLDTLAESIATINDVFDGYDPLEPSGALHEGARSAVDRLLTHHGLGS